MKRLLAAAAGIVALGMTGSAFGADLPLPVKAPPPPPWYDWTGFYIGANGGYSWGRSWDRFSGPGFATFTSPFNMNGGLGGGQIGYNWQFNRIWVIGLEADIQGTGERGSTGLPTIVIPGGAGVAPIATVTSTGTFSQKLPWFGTVRGRVGVEPVDRVLLYFTGGFAYGEVDSTASATASAAFPPAAPFATVTANASAKNTQPGWTAGVGGEWAFISRWSVKAEYIYVDLSAFTNTFTGTGPSFATITARTHFTDNIFRVGINYNFGGPHY
jgi:outer membrane immunogenic protein